MRTLRVFVILFFILLAVDVVAITALGTNASKTFQGEAAPERGSGSLLPGVLIAVILGAFLILLGIILYQSSLTAPRKGETGQAKGDASGTAQGDGE